MPAQTTLKHWKGAVPALTDCFARLEISGRALRESGDCWRKEQRLCLRGCVAYVTLSKQGGSAELSDFVVLRICVSVPCQSISLIEKLLLHLPVILPRCLDYDVWIRSRVRDQYCLWECFPHCFSWETCLLAVPSWLSYWCTLSISYTHFFGGWFFLQQSFYGEG